MPTQTTRLGLEKPDPTENVDIAVINQNMDDIDAAFGSIVGSFRNGFRNGDFTILQRGASGFATTGDVRTADGWNVFSVGGTATPSIVSNSLAADQGTDGAFNSEQVITAGQAAVGDQTQLYQRIESVRRFAGKQVTVSFRAKASAGTPKIGVEASQIFGAGGAPSAQVNTAAGAITISTVSTRYSITFTVPSIAGKTLGTDGTDNLQITFWLSAGTTNAARASNIGIQNATITITDIQIEEGSVATAFERLPQQVQLAWCQRYYYQSTMFALGMCWGATSFGGCTQDLPVNMRATPTLTVVGAAAGWRIESATGSAIDPNAVPIAFNIPGGVSFSGTVAGGLVAGNATIIQSDSGANYFTASAEL